jgi:molybdopterin-guanine dinucleotide biosynthesis protein A
MLAAVAVAAKDAGSRASSKRAKQARMYIGSIVLAGGDSSRMGRPKAGLPFLGSTLLGRTVETLLLCTHPVVVVARDEAQELPPLPLEVDFAYDDAPGQGPLVGLAAGLRALREECDAAFAVGCDVPFLDQGVIGWLAAKLEGFDLVMPRAGGVLQPMAALYRVSVLPEVEALIASGERSPRALVPRVRSRIVEEAEIDAFDPQRRFLRNVNVPDDYQRALQEAEEA